LGRAIAPSFSFITMTLLNDKQIAKLAENDIFLPFVGEKRRELDNGTKAISLVCRKQAMTFVCLP
jgi:hypothetical protein